MGIPKFYRWLSERYPLLNQRFTATEGAPDIDNLYLDMNGIIHNSTHANQKDVKFTEEEMMLRICDYIDKLVQIIRPQKLLFMAIDGVAPRAKMNQQRSRRFKAAKERLELQAEKLRNGEEVKADAFDSNCITPGTPFMERLGKHLRFFIRRKMSEDPVWQSPTVVFSGHEVPGEGEHKIMEYLRWEKRSPHYQPNQRHCLYGLDADLVMLSLVTHEPHFCLLREIVSYTGGNRGQPAREVLENPCAENFVLFHIGLLREYVEVEFSTVPVPFEPSGHANIERVIDDFVLFCMLIGNDFLPALPTLDIAEGALNAIMTIYKELLGTMGGYLTYAGELDRRRLQLLLAKLGAMEQQVLEERAADAEYMENKRAKRAANGQEAWVAASAAARGAQQQHSNNNHGSHGNSQNGAASDGSNSHTPGGSVHGARTAAGPSGNGKGFGGPNARRSAAASMAAAAAANRAAAAAAQADQDEGAEVTAAEMAGLRVQDDTDVSSGVEDESAGGRGTPATVVKLEPSEQQAGPLGAFLQTLGVVGVDAPLEEEEAPQAVAAEPTMMSREARQMMLAGLGQQGLQMWKDRWYKDKLQATTAQQRRKVVESYLGGLHWVLEYYYRGVASWDWYYPYYFAPMASDMVDLEAVQVNFTAGKPFRPFEQLLAVLPAASASLLPPAFQPLMLDPKSPVIDFYPTEFEVDMEGKRAAWEGVVKVPFVDEKRLLEAVGSIADIALTQSERDRNKLGDILVFQRHAGSVETEFCTSTMPQTFRDVSAPNSRMVKNKMPPPLPDNERGFKPELVPGTHTGLNNPRGFPTLKSIQVKATLRNAGVNVLGTPSRKESLILVLPDLGNTKVPASRLAPSLLGKRCFVQWPYLQEAQITRLSDATEQWVLTAHSEPQQKVWQSQEATKWKSDASVLVNELLVKQGLEVGRVELLMHVRVCRGYTQHLDGTLQKMYSRDEVAFPLQCVLRARPGAPAPSAGPAPGDAAAAEEDAPQLPVLTPGDRAVFLGKGHYGALAIVLPELGAGMAKTGKPLKAGTAAGQGVSYHISVIPMGPGGADQGARAARQAATEAHYQSQRYMPGHEVSRRLKINPRVLGRITSNVWISDGDERYDIGLAVRAASKGLCVPGFASPDANGTGWLYSQAMLSVLSEYRAAHPWVFEVLAAQANNAEGSGHSSLKLADALPGVPPDERKAKAVAAAKWVKNSALAAKPLVKSTVQMMPDEAVRMLQLALPPLMELETLEFENVPPALLLPGFTPGPDQIKLAIQGGDFALGDRVVCLLKAGIPPFGHRGTITGVYDDAVEVAFDQEFAGGTNLGGKLRNRSGAQVPKDILLNISRPVTLPINRSQIPRPIPGHHAPATTAAAHAPAAPPAAAAAAAAAAIKRQQQQQPRPATAAAAVAAAAPPPPPSAALKARAGSARAQQPAATTKAPAVAAATTSIAAAAAAHPPHAHQAPYFDAHKPDAASTGAAPPGPPPPLPSASMMAVAGSVSSGRGAGGRQAAPPNPAAGVKLLQKLQSGVAAANAAKATTAAAAPAATAVAQQAHAAALAATAVLGQHAAPHTPPPPPALHMMPPPPMAAHGVAHPGAGYAYPPHHPGHAPYLHPGNPYGPPPGAMPHYPPHHGAPMMPPPPMIGGPLAAGAIPHYPQPHHYVAPGPYGPPPGAMHHHHPGHAPYMVPMVPGAAPPPPPHMVGMPPPPQFPGPRPLPPPPPAPAAAAAPAPPPPAVKAPSLLVPSHVLTSPPKKK